MGHSGDFGQSQISDHRGHSLGFSILAPYKCLSAVVAGNFTACAPSICLDFSHYDQRAETVRKMPKIDPSSTKMGTGFGDTHGRLKLATEPDIISHLARCTAPVRGHRTASGEANCPACGGRSRGYRPTSYPSYPSYSSSGSSGVRRRNGGGGSSRSIQPGWSPASSSVWYTPEEVRALKPVRRSVEEQGSLPDLRDVFLCHAWNDRQGAAKELHDLLESRGVSVWFSEQDVTLGKPLLREIDKGLAKSRVGMVLVTPALLSRLQVESIADKELSTLLARERLVPVVHETTYDALREVSPMLASRSGLSTAEEPMTDVAAKLAELVAL